MLPAPHKWLRRLAMAALLLGMSAGTAPLPVRAEAPPAAAAKQAAYRLQPGDEVAITVSPRKEFDCAGIVLPDGMLYLPNVGGVPAAGRSIPELAEAIRKILDEELVDPKVTVGLVRMAPPPTEKPAKSGTITVVGAASRTGPLPLEEGLRVRRAIDLSGGAEPEADLTQVVILHRDLTRTVVDLSTDERVSNPAHNRLLSDGDSIELRRRKAVRPQEMPRVRVSGQVRDPGPYELRTGMTVDDLLVSAGKTLPLADLARVELHRPGKPLSLLNLEQLRQQGPSGKVLLQAGDEIFVHEQTSRIALIGAVQSPGPRALKPGVKLRDLLAEGDSEVAGAANPAVVDFSGVQLLRRGQPSQKLNLTEVLRKPDHRDNIALQNGDVLFFPPRRGPRRTALDYLNQLGPLGFLFGVF